jgi:prolyl 4-hydroxylase
MEHRLVAIASAMTQTSDLDDGGLPSPHRQQLCAQVITKLDRNPMVERVENEHLDVFFRYDFASAQECADMRAMIDADAQPSTLFSGGEGPEYRTSYSCHLDRDDSLVAGISKRIAAMMGIDPALAETIQGQRYTIGQEYREHCDWFSPSADYWPRMRAQGGQRCWTAMIYLCNVEAGGETHFPCLGFMVPPREGMILIWNNLDGQGAPNPYSMHAANPVTEGSKYVLTQWFRERPWILPE